jgi:hypothetical protein
MSKFKPGDRVIRLDEDYSYEKLEKGGVYTVSVYRQYNNSSSGWCVELEGIPFAAFDDFRFELEEVYNSPLYQLIKESDADS